MSRSNKKSPVIGITTASSEKEDKRIANRSGRRINKALTEGENSGPANYSLEELIKELDAEQLK